MKIYADVNKLNIAAEDLSSARAYLNEISHEIEDIRKELKKQSEFEDEVICLKRINENVSDDVYLLRLLARAAERISEIYKKTETENTECFEDGSLRRSLTYTDADEVITGTVNSDGLSRILYNILV